MSANAPIAFIGYGSLMSGLGLEPLGCVEARRAVRVALHNAQRGFGKEAQIGDRLAVVLEPIDPESPLAATRLPADAPAADQPEGLLLEVALPVLQRISSREGYDPKKLLLLDGEASQQSTSLPEYLWHLLVAARFDIAAYRAALFARLGYTSAHYIPHPVALGDGEFAVTFLAPGTEGSGSPDVAPIRVRRGNASLLTAAAAWRQRPNRTQLDYFAACFLGALHGICQLDLIADVEPQSEFETLLRTALSRRRAAEGERFLAATGLGDDDYRNGLGNPAILPQRSGLSRLLTDSGA